MDFSLSPEIDAIRSRIRAFVEERLIPLERDPRELRRAREHRPARAGADARRGAEAGALGARDAEGARRRRPLDGGIAPCYEEMNRSIFGPVVVQRRGAG